MLVVCWVRALRLVRDPLLESSLQIAEQLDNAPDYVQPRSMESAQNEDMNRTYQVREAWWRC